MRRGTRWLAVCATVASALVLNAPASAQAPLKLDSPVGPDFGDPEFCAPEAPLEDFGLEDLPPVPLPAAPIDGDLPFGPKTVELGGASGNAVLTPGGTIGFHLSSINFYGRTPLEWALRHRLSPVDATGAVGEVVARGRERVRLISSRSDIYPELKVPRTPGFFLYEIEIADFDGNVLAHYGSYVRMEKLFWDVRLALNRTTFAPGERVLSRVENRGTTMPFQGAEYELQRRVGGRWIDRPLPGGAGFLLWLRGVALGWTGPCNALRLPRDFPPGRYRIVKEIEGSIGDSDRPIRLTAPFRVTGRKRASNRPPTTRVTSPPSRAQISEATADPLASGTVQLNLGKRFAGLLAEEGVNIQAKDGTQRRKSGSVFLLPVSGGSLDTTAGAVEAEMGGTLTFVRDGRKLPLREIVMKTTRDPLSAKVGGGQLKLVKAGTVDYARVGFGAEVSARPLRLTEKLATRLGKKLGLRDVFEEGQVLGTLQASVTPWTLGVLPVGQAGLVPDPAFLKKLDDLFVSLNPIAPAERAQGGGFFGLPITGGALSPDGFTGTLRTDGALELLKLGSGKVVWREFWFDGSSVLALADATLDPTPTYPGKVGQVPVLKFGGGSPGRGDEPTRKTTVIGSGLMLTAAGAAQLNQVLAGGSNTFAEGERFGWVSFTATLR